MTIAKKMLRDFDEEFALTRSFLNLVPDDKLTWKPHEKSMELGRLAWHLSDFPEWVMVTIQQDTFRMGAEDAEKMSRSWRGKTRAEMLARFDADMPKARAALAAADDAAMERHWKMEWGGQTVVDDPREYVCRKWAMHHMVHHRAQLGVYLRMLGIAIPGCYGPSADEMPAQQAAAD